MVSPAAHLRLKVRLTPRAARDVLEGETQLSDGTHGLAARVRAVPEKGAANEALLGLIAKSLGVARSRVSLVAGHASRLKSVRVDGEPEKLAAAIAMLRKIPSPKKETA